MINVEGKQAKMGGRTGTIHKAVLYPGGIYYTVEVRKHRYEVWMPTECTILDKTTDEVMK